MPFSACDILHVVESNECVNLPVSWGLHHSQSCSQDLRFSIHSVQLETLDNLAYSQNLSADGLASLDLRFAHGTFVLLKGSSLSHCLPVT